VHLRAEHHHLPHRHASSLELHRLVDGLRRRLLVPAHCLVLPLIE
jgi:hypothetical protein